MTTAETLGKSKGISPGVFTEKILLVDDDPLIVKALEYTLQRDNFIVVGVNNGTEAINVMEKEAFALIICDQGLPDVSGSEVLRRAQLIAPDTVRIALTGNSDLSTVLKAINIGHVEQFILKPWDDAMLKQLVSYSLSKYRLVQENKNLQELIIEQHQELEKNHENLRYELQLGGRINEELLMGKIPQNFKGMSIAATTIPSQEIDGDFFDFYQPQDQLLDLAVGDVMGKGIAAALVGTALKTQLQRFAMPFTQSKYCEQGSVWQDDLLTPKEILEKTHEAITQQLMLLEYFVCLFYGRFNLEKRTFTFVDCGSTKPLYYNAKRKQTTFLKGNNIPIGMVSKKSYSQMEIPFNEGDLFVFYSDGVTECRSPLKELFGDERLFKLVDANFHRSPQELMNLIKSTVVDFSKKEKFDDDLTVIIVKITADIAQRVKQQVLGKFSSELSQIPAIREFVHRFCQKAPGNWETVSLQLQLAINEAFCNIVKHSYKGQKGKEILIQGELGDEGFLIDICDQGDEFDPLIISEPSLAGDLEGGFGLYIIRQIADNVVYLKRTTTDGWNRLRIFKRYNFKEVEMDFTHITKNDVLIVTPKGESLDARESRDFKEKVINLITNNDSLHVIIDLQQLQFIDSSGLGSFLAILKNLHSQGGELKLAQMNKPIRSIFELVSMHKIFEIFNSTEDAIKSFK